MGRCLRTAATPAAGLRRRHAGGMPGTEEESRARGPGAGLGACPTSTAEGLGACPPFRSCTDFGDGTLVRMVVPREPLMRILRWLRRALFAGGVLALGYCAFALIDAAVFQARASRNLDRVLWTQSAARPEAPQPAPAPVASGGVLGRIVIPRVGLSVIVVEGLEPASLRRAAGHIPGTALPGEPGNVGLAGHRDTFFRSLKELKIKDEIQLSTLKDTFRYEVESLQVVAPTDTAVLAPSSGNELTLVTCYPFNYIGPAPMRWIVRARQVVR